MRHFIIIICTTYFSRSFQLYQLFFFRFIYLRIHLFSLINKPWCLVSEEFHIFLRILATIWFSFNGKFTFFLNNQLLRTTTVPPYGSAIFLLEFLSLWILRMKKNWHLRDIDSSHHPLWGYRYEEPYVSHNITCSWFARYKYISDITGAVKYSVLSSVCSGRKQGNERWDSRIVCQRWKRTPSW